MRRLSRLVLVGIAILLFGLNTAVVNAQTSSVKLIWRAIMPAESYADGPASGAALTANKTTSINGARVPFASQPVGSVSALIKGTYKGTWLLLSDKGFGSANSDDYLLRAYTIDVDWRSASAGSGSVTLLDWYTLTDPRKQIKTPIKNASTSGRNLTGADFDPRALARAPDGTLWVAEGRGPSLLHITSDGIMLQAPIAIAGGALQAMGITVDGKTLLIALKVSSAVQIVSFTLATSAFAPVFAFPLDAPNHEVSDFRPINATQALAIEQDDQQGANAKYKRIFLVDLPAPGGKANKTLLVDLLNIADPANIGTNPLFGPVAGVFGLKPFSFPYRDISGVYPSDPATLVVVNNNHFPFGTARTPNVAENTELIGLQLPKPLTLQLNDTQE